MNRFSFAQMQLIANRAYAFDESEVPNSILLWKSYFYQLGYKEVDADVWLLQ